MWGGAAPKDLEVSEAKGFWTCMRTGSAQNEKRPSGDVQALGGGTLLSNEKKETAIRATIERNPRDIKRRERSQAQRVHAV